MECGAQKRGGKGICKALAMDNGRCRIHGGKTPSGIASPQYKDGRYSKYMPTRLKDRYEAAASDPDLLNLRSEISLIDARMTDVLEGVNNGEAGEMWKRLKGALRDYDHPKGATEPARDLAKNESFQQMRWLINEGFQEYMSWIELRQLAQERKSLVDGERSRLKDMQQLITAERAYILINALQGSIRKHVTDRSILESIQTDIRALVNYEPS